MHLQGVVLVICFYSPRFNVGVKGYVVNSEHNSPRGESAQDHSYDYSRSLTATSNFHGPPAPANRPGATLSEQVSLPKGSITHLVNPRSEEASDGSGEPAAGRFLDSITRRKDHPLITFRRSLGSTATAFWKMVKQPNTPKRTMNEREVDSQIPHFWGAAKFQPPFTNNSLSLLRSPEAPANHHPNLPSTIVESTSIASDTSVSTDAATFVPPPPYITDAANPTSFRPPSDSCNRCYIFYPWAHVYYPSAETSNTECLSALTAAPTPNLPPLGLEPRPGYAYVVLPELSAEINCTPFTTYKSKTFSFPPHQLSTMSGPQNLTAEFNFEDLPCPPPKLASEVQWFYNPEYNPRRRYSPFLAPFSEIWDLDPAFKAYPCTVALNQGMDPASMLASATKPTPPKGHMRPARLARHRRDALEGAHRLPSLPVETNPPLSAKPSMHSQ
ncbi:MAG: hypothetical protein LQ339_002215 [Xanthoria mediterranea]|nr:MAG: hypothetical protein LQ339_002215 [Xanthoria mediterranea]